jgi:hypothetical protein
MLVLPFECPALPMRSASHQVLPHLSIALLIINRRMKVLLMLIVALRISACRA